MEEIWKDVKGYEAWYMVSNLGRVAVTISTREILHIVPLRLNNSGYLQVHLRKGGVDKNFRVSRLVAQTFLRNSENKPQVNHINGIKSDNTVTNLEWCTASENALHAYRTGLAVAVRGVDHPSNKLSESQVKEIRALMKDHKYKKIDLANKYGVNHSTISRILSGEKWRHII